jgi:hypothetical protein
MFPRPGTLGGTDTAGSHGGQRNKKGPVFGDALPCVACSTKGFWMGLESMKMMFFFPPTVDSMVSGSFETCLNQQQWRKKQEGLKLYNQQCGSNGASRPEQVDLRVEGSHLPMYHE